MIPPLLSDMHTSLLGVLRHAYSCSLESFFKLKYNQICMLRSVFTCGKLTCGGRGMKILICQLSQEVCRVKSILYVTKLYFDPVIPSIVIQLQFSGYWFSWMCSSLFPVSHYEQRMLDYWKINCHYRFKVVSHINIMSS